MKAEFRASILRQVRSTDDDDITDHRAVI